MDTIGNPNSDEFEKAENNVVNNIELHVPNRNDLKRNIYQVHRQVEAHFDDEVARL